MLPEKLDPNISRDVNRKARIADLERQLADLSEGLDAVHTRIQELIGERGRLREALEKYGRHENNCDDYSTPCSCGFEEALAGDGGQKGNRLVTVQGEARRARTTLEDIQRWVERGELAKAGSMAGGEILTRKCRYALTGDGAQEKSDA